ncbi:MAG: methyltransferase [Aeromicrobium sp.]|uniref:class I SAM-dependent methyltransferase n=1 Tax=Aeromicrobium sp. TaxID=1871063 RepID=UPI0039E53A27
MSDHYFSATPDVEDRRREVTVRIAGRELAVTTAAGVFSGDGLDHATAVLLEHMHDAEPQRVLDLGCGWGPVALALGLRWPGTEVWAVDVNERALALTAANARRHGLTVRTALPEDVPDDLRFDAIWSNPPIRIGKQALHALLLHWLDRLSDDGTLTMIVGKNLGADSLQRWLTDQGRPTERLASAKGFRILRTRRAT